MNDDTRQPQWNRDYVPDPGYRRVSLPYADGHRQHEAQLPEEDEDEYEYDDYRPRRRSWLYRIWRSFWVSVNVLAALGLLTASYAGYVSPTAVPVAGVAGMTLPVWIVACVFLLTVNLIFSRRDAIVNGVALVCCAGPIWNYCPLNIPGAPLTQAERQRSFTLLSYNVYGFNDRNMAPDDSLTPNRTLEYILAQNADIVCLGEAELLDVDERCHITRDQIARVYRQYPYIMLGGETQRILSKYPVEALPVQYHQTGPGLGDFVAYRVDIRGTKVTVFNCHFQSIGLTDADKSFYGQLTRFDAGRSSVGLARRTLIAKLAAANRERAKQVRWLGQYIQRYGGPNTIVCGDFNDVPNCYSLRHLADYGLKEVYPKVGFGPLVTYNANRFYFQIDHVLYRGALKPLSQERGNLTSSDHYPLLTTFELTAPLNR